MLEPIEIETFEDLNNFIEKYNENEENFTLIQLSATWCGPCKNIKKELSSDGEWLYKYDGKLKWIIIDIDKMSEDVTLSKIFTVKSIPTFFLLKNKKTIDKLTGANKNELIKFLNKHINFSFDNIINNNKSNDF